MGSAADKLDAYGLDALCEAIANRNSLTAIAATQEVSIGSLLNWIAADPERSARVREARAATALLWDERSERLLEDAEDEFGLKKAKELAHHYRWRAAKIAPREYGERVQHSNDPDNPMPAPTFILQPVAPVKPE